MTRTERRSIEAPVELRAAPEAQGGPGTLAGYALRFNEPSRDLGGFIEVIDPSAVEATEDGALDLARHTRVIARTNHDSNMLLGTTDAQTLRLYVDDEGVRYEVDLPDTTHGRDLAILAVRRDIRFSSFAFRVLPNGANWEEDSSGQLVRRVTALTLVDVAPVADPAYWSSSSELARDFDLDAIRASLSTPPETEAAPHARAAVIGRAHAIQDAIERSRYGIGS